MTTYKNIGDIIATIGIFLLALLILFSHLYSYASFEKTDLLKIETTVSNVESHYSQPTSWIAFTADDGLRYYVHTNDLKESKNDILDSLREKYNGEKLTVYYTNRPELFLFSLMHFGGMKRVAAIECDSDIIIGLDDFNHANRGMLWIAIIIAAVLLLVCLWKIRDLIPKSNEYNPHK